MAGKIANARTVLKRYARERGADSVQTHERALIQMSGHVARAPTLDVLRALRDYGDRVQKSVFECRLRPLERRALLAPTFHAKSRRLPCYEGTATPFHQKYGDDYLHAGCGSQVY